MKLLTLIRHAKSDWRYEGLSDFERPLNARGRRNAPQMGQHLRNFLPPLDCLVASPANRAITTARLLADELGVDKDAIVVIPALYLAASDLTTSSMSAGAASDQHVALVGHNPGVSQLCHQLADQAEFGEMPTCAAAHLKLDIGSWTRVQPGCGELLRFDSPKRLKQTDSTAH